MLDRLLPRHADNNYHGHRLALWLFGLVVLMKAGMSLSAIFNGHDVASNADGIPLDTFTPAGAGAVVSLFAVWGVSHLALCVLCLLAMVRYRAMVPFLFALLLLEHLGRRLAVGVLPIVRTGTPPGFYVNLGLIVLMVAGLALSLRGRKDLPAPA